MNEMIIRYDVQPKKPIETMAELTSLDGCAVMLLRRDNLSLLICGVVESRDNLLIISDNEIFYTIDEHSLSNKYYCIITGKKRRIETHHIVRECDIKGDVWITKLDGENTIHDSIGEAMECLYVNEVPRNL